MVNKSVLFFTYLIINTKSASFGNSTDTSQLLLLSVVPLGDMTMKSPCNAHVTVIWRLYCEVMIIGALWRVIKWCHKEVTAFVDCSIKRALDWEKPSDYFVLMSLGESLCNNYNSDSSEYWRWHVNHWVTSL